jgi:enoyl-[acyl-carrier protein] reductase I
MCRTTLKSPSLRETKARYGKLHVLVHSVAYAPAEELKGDFSQTTREGFRIAHDVSVYSLIAVARAAAPLMEEGGSIITMTYYGAEKVVPHYNVMGVAKAALECTVRYLAQDLGRKNIRVNAISAGPIKTLAARGISGLGDMLKSHAERAPLQRNVDVNEVGSTGVFGFNAGSGITGEVVHVDCGYNIMGLNNLPGRHPLRYHPAGEKSNCGQLGDVPTFRQELGNRLPHTLTARATRRLRSEKQPC